MNMHLADFIIGNHYNTVTDGLKKCLEVYFLFNIQRLIKKNNEFSTITEFNLFLLGFCLSSGYRSSLVGRNRKIDFFSKITVIGTL